MSIVELAILYGAVGVGCAVAAVVFAKGSRGVDAVLMLGLWPLYGPFALARYTGNDAPRPRGPLADALARAAQSPLAVLLPDPETLAALGARLDVARDRIADIDRLLVRPEFREHEAVARLDELAASGASDAAQSSTRCRIQNIRRLAALKNRFERELEDVHELLIQLTTQAELVRLVGNHDPSTQQLVTELVTRVEGLDHMLGEEASLLAGGPT